MKYASIVLIVLIVIFYIANHPEIAPISLKSADQQFEELLSSNVAQTTAVARVAERYPQQSQVFFHNKLMNLEGEIMSFELISVGRDILQISLAGCENYSVYLSLNLKKFNTLVTYANTDSHYEIVGHEVLYFPNRHSHGIVIYRRGQILTQRARFVALRAHGIQFNAE